MLCKARRGQDQVQWYGRGKSQYRLHLEISFIDSSSHNAIKKSHEEDKKAQTGGWGQMCGYSAWRFKPCSIRCRRSSGAKLGECERRVVLVPQCPGNLRVVSGLGKWHAGAIAPSQTDVASARAEYLDQSDNDNESDDGRAGLSRIEIDAHGLVQREKSALIAAKTKG